jgi:molecular chaperone HtpG
MPMDSKANLPLRPRLWASNSPLVITQSEYMRRMKEMSQFQPGMSFYGQMPDSYMVVLNTDHKLLMKEVLDETKKVLRTSF